MIENNKMTSGFATPKDYFDNLSDRIVDKISGEATTNLISKTSGFIVPEDYFEKNEAKLLTKINFTKVKVYKSIRIYCITK